MPKMEKNENFVFYYNQFKNKIYSYFLYRVDFNQKLAEDLTSEVFLKALKNFDGFNHTKPFQAWIFTISRNHLINHYKIAKRNIPLEEVGDFLRQAGTKMEERHELERIIKIISSMEDHDKEVLLLKFVEELTNSEIACVLEKEEGAIRTQICRSLSKLREMLKK